jgi:hypothetical protein
MPIRKELEVFVCSLYSPGRGSVGGKFQNPVVPGLVDVMDSQADGFAVDHRGANVPMTCSAAVVNPPAPIDGGAVGLGQEGLDSVTPQTINPGSIDR